MPSKHFLPTNQRKEDDKLMSTPIYTKMALLENGETKRGTAIPVSSQCAGFFGKLLPFMGFLSVTFGTIAVGFSTQIIGANNVGYYQNESSYYPPGVYLQTPWRKVNMLMANVGSRSILFTEQTGMTADGFAFVIETISVEFHVCDVEKYVNRLRAYRGEPNYEKIFSAKVQTKILEYLQSTDVMNIFANQTLSIDFQSILDRDGVCVDVVKYSIIKSAKTELVAPKPTTTSASLLRRQHRHVKHHQQPQQHVVRKDVNDDDDDITDLNDTFRAIERHLTDNTTEPVNQNIAEAIEPKVRRKRD